VKVNAQAFFNFSAAHVPLLRQLAERTGELSAGEVMRLVREQADAHEELPETTWRRLREYQILIPSEPGGESYLMAEPNTCDLAPHFSIVPPTEVVAAQSFPQQHG
jgi:hypothetical protein